MDYREKLQNVIEVTALKAGVKDTGLIESLLVDAILDLNYETLEWQRRFHQNQDPNISPNATIKLAQREMSR